MATRDEIYDLIYALDSNGNTYVGLDSADDKQFADSTAYDAMVTAFELMKAQLAYIQTNLDDVVVFSGIDKATYNQVQFKASAGTIIIYFPFDLKSDYSTNVKGWVEINEWIDQQETYLTSAGSYWITDEVPDTDIFGS